MQRADDSALLFTKNNKICISIPHLDCLQIHKSSFVLPDGSLNWEGIAIAVLSAANKWGMAFMSKVHNLESLSKDTSKIPMSNIAYQ